MADTPSPSRSWHGAWLVVTSAMLPMLPVQSSTAFGGGSGRKARIVMKSSGQAWERQRQSLESSPVAQHCSKHMLDAAWLGVQWGYVLVWSGDVSCLDLVQAPSIKRGRGQAQTSVVACSMFTSVPVKVTYSPSGC